MRRRVVVTGLGCVSPVGNTVAESWANLLAGQPGIETPSERVRSKIGIPAVAEPAALRAAGASRLLVTKQKGPGLTLALARKPAHHPG